MTSIRTENKPIVDLAIESIARCLAANANPDSVREEILADVRRLRGELAEVPR